MHLFPDPVTIRGCYWTDAGLVLRKRLTDMGADEIAAASAEFEKLAVQDLRPVIQSTIRAAAGIWTLSRT